MLRTILSKRLLHPARHHLPLARLSTSSDSDGKRVLRPDGTATVVASPKVQGQSTKRSSFFAKSAAEKKESLEAAVLQTPAQALTSLHSDMQVVAAENRAAVERTASVLKYTFDSPRGKGTFVFATVPEDEQILTFQSPDSALQHRYRFDAGVGDWVGLQDGHNMKGMFVRDLVRYASGLPKFAGGT